MLELTTHQQEPPTLGQDVPAGLEDGQLGVQKCV